MPANGPRVLVVDDDADFRDAIRHVLEWEGYTVVVAADGVEAITSVIERAPALVLIDLFMPIMDGPRLLAALRAQGFAMPIVVFSARDGGEQLTAPFQVDAFLAKPFDLDQLLTLVTRFCAPLASPDREACGAAGLGRAPAP